MSHKAAPEELDFQIISTSGDTNLGGMDIDQVLTNYFLEKFNTEHATNLTNSEHFRAINRLRTACEKVKRSLSSKEREKIIVGKMYGGIDFTHDITRAELENMCSDLFLKTLEPVKKALSDAKLKVSDIDQIVLVGGSTRIPKVQQILQDFFNGKALNHSINPDEAVAYGAAVQAALISGVRYNSIGKINIRDVTPLSLGIAIDGDLMSKFISRNTQIPVKKTSEFITSKNFQTCIVCTVYEGERSIASKNHKLGEFKLDGIPSLPRGRAKIDVTFNIDNDGILSIAAEVKSTGKSNSLIVREGRLDAVAVDFMIEEAKNTDHKDKIYRERVEARKSLKYYASDIEIFVKETSGTLTRSDNRKLTDAWKNESSWLERNQNAEKEIFDARLAEIMKICEPIKTETKRNEAKNLLTKFLEKVDSFLKNNTSKMQKEEVEIVENASKDAKSWLSENLAAEGETIKSKHKEVEKVCEVIIGKFEDVSKCIIS